MKILNKSNITFIGEQDGEIEKEFKKHISIMLDVQPMLIRAYLAQIKYEKNDNKYSVALCFASEASEASENEYVVKEAARIFKSMFGAKEHLDILFLDSIQEHYIREVCSLFFVSFNYQYPNPDFYLSSSEGYELENIFSCYKRQRLAGKNPDGYLFCDIEPPLIGQKYGFGDQDIYQVILSSRHQHYSLFPIKIWPAYVHVSIPLVKNLENKPYIDEHAIKLIGWAELYKNKEDVNKAK